MIWLPYELLFLIGFLLYLPRAIWRRRLPHRGWTMRLGRYPRGVTEALAGRPSIWLHAVSVGEVLAAQPLIRALTEADPARPLVLSTITPGGFQMASTRFAPPVVPIYVPLDLTGCATRALETIRPRALLLMESELWPNLIRLTHARNIPVAVVNGRVSPRSFRRSRLITPWLRGMLDRVALFLMQSQEDADRLIQLGAPPGKVHVVGSLKWDASRATHASAEALREAAMRLGLSPGDPVLVAGSTHRGEEEPLIRAFLGLRGARQGLRLIIAPRHLERVGEVEHLLQRHGLKTARLSARASGQPWEAGLIDTFGHLPVYYGLASVVFIGGSLIPHGGQNPLEAASLGKPIAFGPSMHNFSAITHQLLAHHAARQLTPGEDPTALLHELLANPAEAQAMGARARELTERFQGATQRTLHALHPLLFPRTAS